MENYINDNNNNNNTIDENQNIFDSLVAENDELKEQVKNLSSELENLRRINSDKVTVEKYYIRKYTENFNEIRKLRLDSVNAKLSELENEYHTYCLEAENLDQIAVVNKDLQDKINELDSKIKDNNRLLDEIYNDLHGIEMEYQDKQHILKKATLAYYDTIIKALKNNTGIDLVMTTVGFVIKQLDLELYDLILACRDLSFRINEKNQEYDLTKEKIRIQNNEYEEEIEKLNNSVRLHTYDELKVLMDEAESKVEAQRTLKKELIVSFDEIKRRDTKAIIDEISYFKVRNYSSIDIADEMEKSVAKKCDVLKSKETLYKLNSIKKLTLSALEESLKKLNVIKDELDNLITESNNIYQVQIEAESKIKQLSSYIESANYAISHNRTYFNTIQKYNEVKENISELNTKYEEIERTYNNIKLERSEKLSIGAEEDVIRDLSSKLASITNEKNELSDKLRDARDELRSIEQKTENIKLLAVFNEKEFAEAYLPSLYSKVRQLKTRLTENQLKMDNLRKELSQYDSIKEEINVLRHEINNQ